MKGLIEKYVSGIEYLVTDDLISFYTYFTIIFAECAFLWSHFSTSIAIPFTIILLAYVLNVIVFAWLKGEWEGYRKELIFSRLYVVTFIIVFIVGCLFNVIASIVLTIIPLVITAISVGVRVLQNTAGISKFTDKIFRNIFIYCLSQVLLIGGPCVLFGIIFANINGIPTILTILIPTLYWFCIPLMVLLEDNTAACNIFEIAYDVTYSMGRKI